MPLLGKKYGIVLSAWLCDLTIFLALLCDAHLAEQPCALESPDDFRIRLLAKPEIVVDHRCALAHFTVLDHRRKGRLGCLAGQRNSSQPSDQRERYERTVNQGHR